MFVLKTLVSPGFLMPAAQWWFIVGVTLVVFFVLLALVLLWVAWKSLRAAPDQREVGDDGLLGLVSSETPPTPALAAEASVATPLPVPPVTPPIPPAPVIEPVTPSPALHAAPAPAPPGAVTEDIAAYWSENPPSAVATSSPAPHAEPVLPVEIRPRVTHDQLAGPTSPLHELHEEVELRAESTLPDPDAVTTPLIPAPAAGSSNSEPVSPPPGLLAEDIRAQLAQSGAPPPAPPKTTGPLGGRPTGPLPPSPPPPLSEPENVPPAPRAGLTERLPVQRKSLRPPATAPTTTPKDEAVQRAIAPPSASAATTAVIAASETMALSRETRDAAGSDQPRFETSAPAAALPAPPPPLPVQQVPAVRPQPALPPAGTLPPAGSPSASSVAPPRFLADDRPTGIRRETSWLGVGLVVYAVVLGGLVVVFFPTVRNWLLPSTWAERVAAIPRALGLESPPPPPLPVKQVEVRQYANTYSSAPKGAGGKVVRLVTIAGLVKNITNETLYDLRVEIELYPREPEGAPPERRTLYLVPNLLGPQQEGRYTLTVADAEYRQSSLKRVVTGDGKDLKEVPAVFIQGTLTPPDEAEAKPAPAKPTAPNRRR